MKRCYIVTKESELHKKYDEWIKSENKIKELFKEFSKEQGIKTKKYSYYHNKLYIVPTDEDLEKFKGVLCKPINNNLRSFKNNSKVMKIWNKKIEGRNIKYIKRPDVWSYFNTFSYGMTTQLFKHDDILYCSFAINEDFDEVPEGLVEIKESEFCKIVEEIRSGK